MIAYQFDCLLNPRSVWVDSEIMQHLKHVKRSGPGLARSVLGFIRVVRGEASASCPLAVRALQRKQPGAPTLICHACAFVLDDLRCCVGKIPENLPAKGRVGIQQPVYSRHPA